MLCSRVLVCWTAAVVLCSRPLMCLIAGVALCFRTLCVGRLLLPIGVWTAGVRWPRSMSVLAMLVVMACCSSLFKEVFVAA